MTNESNTIQAMAEAIYDADRHQEPDAITAECSIRFAQAALRALLQGDVMRQTIQAIRAIATMPDAEQALAQGNHWAWNNADEYMAGQFDKCKELAKHILAALDALEEEVV
jgi:hypothetical protein